MMLTFVLQSLFKEQMLVLDNVLFHYPNRADFGLTDTADFFPLCCGQEHFPMFQFCDFWLYGSMQLLYKVLFKCLLLLILLFPPNSFQKFCFILQVNCVSPGEPRE